MSLSVGGYHGAYAHPGASMGLATPHDYYGAAATPGQFYTGHGYPEYAATERDFYNNWVLNGAPDVSISPESFGSPSPPGMVVGTTGYQDAVQTVGAPQWRNYPMTTEELAIAHNIPLSELGQYEAYTNRFGDRCIRRRTSANKKERRRTLSINNAFSNLRGSIPNVPSDTKLSKIKTLRLAISYISYLSNILEKGDTELTHADFQADISRKRERRSAPVVTSEKKPSDSCESDDSSESCGASTSPKSDGKTRGRTGWPQEVWASELIVSPLQQGFPSQEDSRSPTGSMQ